MAKKQDEQIQDLTNKWKRALADYQNLEKRIQSEKDDFIKFSNSKLVLKILTALDTLKKAEDYLKDEGLSLGLKQLVEALAEEGLVKLEVTGRAFDPNIMECVGTDEGEENKVTEELRAGYLLNNRLLRPAQVKVGKAT